MDEENQMSLPIKEVVLGPGEGSHLTIGNSQVTFKAVGTNTDGHLGLFEQTLPPGGTSPEPHLHRHMEEMFYVLEGEVEILVGEQTVQGQAGAFVLVPRGTPHAFANRGTQAAKLLIMFSPAGSREKYFEGLAELLKDGQPPDRKALVELMRRFDQEPVNI
jgi:quercetin dioxygenase-like cupin family protein